MDKKERPANAGARFGDEKKPFGGKKPHEGGRPYGEKKSYGDRKPREDGRAFGEKKPFGDRKPHEGGRTFGEGKPYSEKKPYGDKKPREDGRPYGEKKPYGDRKPREDGKPFGERKPYGDRKPREDGKPFGERKPYGDRKPHEDGKPFGEKKPYGAKKPFGGNKPARGEAPKAEPAFAPGARDVARRAYASVARRSAYTAQALDRELAQVALSDEDRRLAASIFYTAVENRLRIEGLLRSYMKARPEDGILDTMAIAAAQLLYLDRVPDHAAVDEAVKQARRAGKESATALVNGVLRNLIRDRDAGALTLPDRDAQPEKYISEKYSLTPPLAAALVEAYGIDTAETIAAWSPARGRLTLRPNRLRMTDEAFEAWLSEQGDSYERGLVPGSYRVAVPGDVGERPGYREGFYSVQGESSMLAAYAVGAKAGQQILDACAAPGGKTCLMAEMMRGTGRVYAWDLHEHRVELIRSAANRLGLDNIRPQTRDAAIPNRAIEGMMDAVLIDAPCTGLGVMAEKPDIKHSYEAEKLETLLPVQKAILDACSACVRPGGTLVYSTCTLLPAENEEQIRAFLARHPDFEPQTDDGWLPEPLRPLFKDGMLQLLPGRDGIEGFFIARLVRKAVPYAGKA